MNAKLNGVLWILLAVTVGLGACSDATGPGGAAGSRSVTLSFGLGSGGAAPSPSLFAQGLELTDGTNTLVIESAEIVMREIEFERVETAGCDSELGLDNDECEKFEIGPFVVPLPLDGSVSQELTAQVDTGTYDEIEFEIHKVEDFELALLGGRSDLADISIKVTGTYNGQGFEYTSRIDEEQELELSSPLIVTPDPGPVNVTLSIDLSSWFVDSGGMLVDPASANDGQPNESLVTDNIRTSIEGFRDDDHDGVPHDDDLDEVDS